MEVFTHLLRFGRPLDCEITARFLLPEGSLMIEERDIHQIPLLASLADIEAGRVRPSEEIKSMIPRWTSTTEKLSELKS